jgi:hypothetical protein
MLALDPQYINADPKPALNASKVLKLRKILIKLHFTGGEVSECVAAAWEGSSQCHHQTLQRGEGSPVS